MLQTPRLYARTGVLPKHATDVLKSVTTETRSTLLRCWTQPGTTAAAAMFVINPETTVVDAVSTTLLAESPFIRIASFRLPSRNRDNRFGMTLSSTATTTMSSAEPGFTELNPARSILPVRSDRVCRFHAQDHLVVVEIAGSLVADAGEPFGYRAVAVDPGPPVNRASDRRTQPGA